MRYFSPSTVAFVLLAISLQAYSAPVVGKGDSPASPPLDQTPGAPVAVPASIPQQDEHNPHAHTGGPPHHHHHHHPTGGDRHAPSTGGDSQDNNGAPPVPAAPGSPQEQPAEAMHESAGASSEAIDTSKLPQAKGSSPHRRASRSTLSARDLTASERKADEEGRHILLPKNMWGDEGRAQMIHHRDVDGALEARGFTELKASVHAKAKEAKDKLLAKFHSKPKTSENQQQQSTEGQYPDESSGSSEGLVRRSEFSRRDMAALEARGERMDSLRDAIFGKPKPSTSATDPSQSSTSPTDTSAY